jgi:hypothetical protein
VSGLYESVYGPVYPGVTAVPDPAYDSLVIAGRFECLGAGDPGAASLDPAFPGALFQLQPGYDFGAPQPLTDFLGSLSLDGELPSGRRAGNRTFSLPVNIKAPDFSTAAAATEALLAAVNEPSWTLTWTRKQGTDPAQLPLVFDCFRAHASVVQGGGLDGWNINSINAVTLSFDALPYGRSDTPVVVPLASPLPGGPAPAAAVILDTFSTVSGTDFTQSSKHVLDSFSAKWNHSGGSTYPTYSKSFSALSLAGLYNVTAYVGFGAATPGAWQNPILFTFRLGDSHGKFLNFSLTKNCYPSNDPANPAFTLIHARIPLGVATFDYANVTSYRISAQNAPSGLFTPANFGFDTYWNHVICNPQSIQVPATRGYVYSLPGVQGTARAPVSVAAQLPGNAVTEVLDTPGAFQWTAPAGLTGGVADVTQIAPGGAGASLTLSGQGGGGEGGEVAREAALAITAGQTYFGSNGIAGVPQTGITTLAVTTTALPTGTASAAYSYQFAATGGSGTGYTWARSGTALPSALTLSAGGLLSGTLGASTGAPLASGMIFTVTDSLGATANVTLSITVKTAALLAITTTSLPNAAQNVRYSVQLATNGLGTAPLTWNLASGSAQLPSGLTLSAAGLLSGTPAATGTTSFTVQVTDSAGSPHTDTQALTLTVTSTAATTLPLFGWNSGNNYLNGSTGTHQGNWEVIRKSLIQGNAGQAVGYRDYGPNRMPTSWNDGLTIPAAATFAVLSWKPNIDNTLAGQYNAAITSWAKSCQSQWNKNPGSIYVSLWHEGDSLQPGTGGNPTSQQILKLHAYVYPRFKAFAPDVPYGQMFIGLTVHNSPSSWVSCKATIAGGSDLDWYGLDVYKFASSTDTATGRYKQSWDNILALAPNSRVASTENNDYFGPASNRIQWFNDLMTLCLQYNALFYLPFWNGTDNGDPIMYSTSDAYGVNGTLRTILGNCAPATSVPIGQDPPAADATNAFFQGDSVLVQAGGGKSATSITGASGNANISTNTVHHAGGAGAAGATGGGSTPGTPHTVCAAFSAASGSTLTPSVPVTVACPAGDAIMAVTASNSGVVSGVTDTKGNKYLNVSHTGPVGAFYLDYWLATTAADGVSPTVALTTSDSLHPVWTAAGATQEMITQAVSGISPGTALDIVKTNNATSTSMSTGASAALNQASEWAFTAFVNGNGGGSPTGLPAGGYALIATAHAGAGQYLTVAQQVTAATTALTGTATITSSAWVATEITIPFAATGSGHGGGGGSSAGQTAAGAAGSGSVGGTAPDIGGDGGNGSLTPDTAPQNGQAPGGGGGGAAGTGAAIQGGYGAPGRTLITRSTSIEKFSSLLLHIPGPDAPDAFSPLVQLGTPGVAGDGATEYPVPAPLAGGPNADFDGTYTIVAAASTLAEAQKQRRVIITVRQYEYPGGPFKDLHTFPRDFTPVDDVTPNGLVVMADLTLPHWDVPPDASSGYYTVIIDDTNAADVWSDLMFIDTGGCTVIIDDEIPGAYSSFFVDEPPPVRDLGRILGTSSTRAAAISVLDKCLAVSGGPLSVYPGDNQILAWSRQGAPQLSFSYIPRFFSARTP